MNHLEISEITDLIERLNNSGISVHYDGEGLEIKSRKGVSIKQDLFNELSSRKEMVVAYLKELQADESDNINETNSIGQKIMLNGEYYYEITPTQLYWANDDHDREYKENEAVHGILFLNHRISGVFYPDIFKNAVSAVVEHHESLRSTFHKVEETYMMRVESGLSDKFNMEFIDLTKDKEGETDIEKLTRFSGQDFSLNEGPLFRARIIRTGKDEFIIALKLHHIISDSWSNEILLRDLLSVYRDLCRNSPPQLGKLRFQFKEFLAFFNNYHRKNWESQKAYWSRLYNTAPGELIIPGAGIRSGQGVKERIRARIQVLFLSELKALLLLRAKEFNTTLFIVLQAAFKAFLYNKTGQHDLLIGTIISGRASPETYPQIGSYARTDMIRTVFSKDDLFLEAVQKVMRSNEELFTNRAYTLTSAIDALLAPGQDYYSFWKISMLFTDKSLFHMQDGNRRILQEDLGIRVSPVSNDDNPLMPIDMILNFSYTPEQLSVNVHYDSSLYDVKTIQDFFDEYLLYTELVANNPNLTIKRR
ncbi:condensation domain-containing protein [Flavitalea flava]